LKKMWTKYDKLRYSTRLKILNEQYFSFAFKLLQRCDKRYSAIMTNVTLAWSVSPFVRRSHSCTLLKSQTEWRCPVARGRKNVFF